MSGRGNGAAIPAEQALLGGLLLDGRAWSKVAEIVRPGDFSRPDHRLIFGAIAELASTGTPVDVVTVSDGLERDGKLKDAGGLAGIAKLARDTPTAENVVAYAGLVRERAVREQVEQLVTARPDTGELAERLAEILARLKSGATEAPIVLLPLEPVSQWSDRPAPAPRDWIIDGLVPARRLTSLLADGGLGKTTIAVQIAVHVAANRALYGLKVRGGPVLGIFCEDEPEELQRRLLAACAAERLDVGNLDSLTIVSRDGEDNVLCTFENDRMVLTPFYRQLDATVAEIRPRLLILDTLADMFAGNYLSTPHVRQFTKTALGGLVRRYGVGVLLVAHPSTTGINSGQGDGFSTAWNNSVRSRLYLRRPKSEDPDAVADRRVLELKKANYGPGGVSVPLLWRAGAFVPDSDPIEEAATRAPKVDTRLAIALRDFVLAKAPGGSVVTLGAALDGLKGTGALSDGKPETVRKAVSRAFGELVKAGTLIQSKVPRGYRLADPGSGHSGQTRDNVGTPEVSGHRDTRDTPTGQGCPRPEMSLSNVPAQSPEEAL
ncbi:MAG: AAA family ATPase [Proteobacteria bacterium]|nr:AAA family ATPase [Pseudomonadota bacterium]